MVSRVNMMTVTTQFTAS